MLDHCILEKVIEVDRSKVAVIEKLSTPFSVKGVRIFLGHTGFYRSFIKDFSNTKHPLCKLLEKECKFNFNESYLKAFGELIEKLLFAPIIISPDWIEQLKVMCDASRVALCVVLRQRRDKILHPIYYASEALNEAIENYQVTKQKLFIVVFSFEKLLQEFIFW